ncbi:MAG: N-6 DNA methylase, partial [Defluviitaleaceae bacterium]|nr:N-6 DNA methylase [Defluviitaleaceae bacterium]
MTNYVHDYHKAVCEAYRLGNIETSFNAPIIALLTQFGCNARDLSGERSRQAGENIDIKIWRGDDDVTETEPFAGVEVKKVGGIDTRARAQIKKEAALFGYAILTDNLVWEFWRAGEDKMYSGVRLMELVDGKLVLKHENIELFTSLMHDFLLQDPAQIRSSNKLAEYMAIHAKTIRSVITGILKEDEQKLPIVDGRQQRVPLFPELYGLFRRIKADLRPLLNTRSFADMYAQTIVYGLFIARYNDADSKAFNRYEAIRKLQEESALLNRFFEHITNTGTKHPTLDAVIDKLCALYQHCDISALLDCDKRGDTIVHFYEDFLTYYDPALRKSLGVFYTPHQVVRYLVAMVDKLLVEDFGIDKGLANNEQIQITVPSERYEYQKSKGAKKEWLDTKEISVPRVAILDPACGTGTFHAEII